MRVLITFTDVPSEEFIQNIFKDTDIKYNKIENSSGIYFVYFENETITRKAFDLIENYKNKNV